MGLYLTFACMGFSTGWSSVDSIFQQVNKYVMVYEDLSFASSLVYITSAAAATVLLLTFLGLYCAPNGVELRTQHFSRRPSPRSSPRRAPCSSRSRCTGTTRGGSSRRARSSGR